jgi:NAD(P)-dependent dehydrogenase (short-subunit alcohol dehydrogenase family)
MKNYIIIGGTKGIGRKTAELLAGKNDNNIYVLARNKPQEYLAPNIHYIELDVHDFKVESNLFPEVIDGLVYCPGTINLKPFHRLNPEDFLNDWQINFMGAVKSIQTFLPGLKKADNPSVVLFSTVASSLGMPFHSSIASVKSAIEGLTKSLAAEYAPKVRFNCIAPSLTDTTLAERLLSTPEKVESSAQRHPLQRVGNTNDIAQMANFLLSENATWITGQIMHIDGGMAAVK